MRFSKGLILKFSYIIAAFIWKATVENDGYFDYHTVFHVCGILMLFAVLIQLKLKLNYQDKIVEN